MNKITVKIRKVRLARCHTLRYNNIGISSGRSTETYCRCLGSTIWNIPEERAAADAVILIHVHLM